MYGLGPRELVILAFVLVLLFGEENSRTYARYW